MRWPAEVVDSFWDVCCGVTDLRTAKELESTLRKGTGTDHLLEVNSCQCSGAQDECCGNDKSKLGSRSRNSLSPYCFKKCDDDTLGQLLQRYTHRSIFTRDYMAEVAETAAKICNKILSSNECKEVPEKAARATIQRMCLQTSITKVIAKAVQQDRRESQQHTVRDGGLVAYPTSYVKMYPQSPFVQLSSVSPAHMAIIMNKGVAQISNWLQPEEVRELRNNLDRMEGNNIFNDMTPFGPKPYRTDHSLWINGSEVEDKLRMPGVKLLLQKLASLPFELNAKANLSLTVSNVALFSLYRPKAYFQLHTDNGSDKAADNGRTVTTIYFLRPDHPQFDVETRAVKLRVALQLQDEKTKIVPEDNSVLMYLTRDRSIEIEEAEDKTYAVFHWCSGINRA